jgi:hypothetical protein
LSYRRLSAFIGGQIAFFLASLHWYHAGYG